jgi:hypothetical protein
LSKGVAFADGVRSDMARRTAVGVSLVLAMILAITGPVNAASDFDPDDVEGRLDLRWVGAWLTQDGKFRVTISFYDGFRVSALPKVRHGRLRGRGRVSVDLTGPITGLYVRRHGKIVFLYGDFGSSCGLDFPRGCSRARVRRSSDNVLKVRDEVFCDGADLSYDEIKARSALEREDRTLRDRTGTLDLGVPQEC